jgi:hypothetical protein
MLDIHPKSHTHFLHLDLAFPLQIFLFFSFFLLLLFLFIYFFLFFNQRSLSLSLILLLLSFQPGEWTTGSGRPVIASRDLESQPSLPWTERLDSGSLPRSSTSPAVLAGKTGGSGLGWAVRGGKRKNK